MSGRVYVPWPVIATKTELLFLVAFDSILISDWEKVVYSRSFMIILE